MYKENENIEEKLYKLAYIDKVTNIENNNYFLEKGTELLKQQFEGHLLIIDVGKFKIFNKKYGRIIGDNLLKNIGKKLKEILGEKRIITRLANDIFAVILEEKEQKELTKIIEKLLKELSNIEMEKNKYKILISIGVSKIEKEDKDIFEILDKAIIARDEAKKNFNKKYHIFNQELENQIIKEHDIELIIEEGIQNQEFKVFYQPKVNAKNEKVEEAEALVRWERENKLIPPNEFIPVFEKNKFIIQLDKYIYEQVCKDMKEWKEKYNKKIKVSVNISKQHIVQDGFIEEYYKITKKYNINPNEIELEITETTELDERFGISKILEKLKEKGFKISIDDFGTGYSSLSMLQQIPVDVIKIDKSFVNQTKMLEIIMLIAKKLNFKTVVEGVETDSQAQYLKGLGVDLLQGFYYSKPLEKVEFEKYWQNN